MSDAISYARVGPPFNFQGTMLDTQKAAFNAWEAANRGNFSAISTFRRIQSQQLRKAAGALEAFYAAQADTLEPSFVKDTWQPSENGHFLPTQRDDHLPGILLGRVFDRYQDQLGRLDEAVFRMNFLRTQIECLEDAAQDAAEAPAYVASQLTQLDALFAQAHYAGVLVSTSDTFNGQPRYRAHPLDPPTPWERQNAGELLA